MEKARMLHAEGHPTGQIADELSLSTDTITWMLTQGKSNASAPKDVHIDWTVVSSDATPPPPKGLMPAWCTSQDCYCPCP